MQFKVYILQCRCLIILGCVSALASAKPLVGVALERVTEGQFRFVVSISEVRPNLEVRHICGGTLVSPKDVLTAEHCLANKNITLIRVVIGSTDLSRGRKHAITWWISYDHWTEQLLMRRRFILNDLAMAKLRIRANAQIIPAALTNIENSGFYGSTVEVAGWGISNDGLSPLNMEKIRVQVLPLAECEARASYLIGYLILLEAAFFCTAATPYALVNRGDSGSPVIYQNMVIGITKGSCPFPEIDVHPEKLNIHFGISYYLDFINYIIQNV